MHNNVHKVEFVNIFIANNNIYEMNNNKVVWTITYAIVLWGYSCSSGKTVKLRISFDAVNAHTHSTL
jgi:hypothetical protein